MTIISGTQLNRIGKILVPIPFVVIILFPFFATVRPFEYLSP